MASLYTDRPQNRTRTEESENCRRDLQTRIKIDKTTLKCIHSYRPSIPLYSGDVLPHDDQLAMLGYAGFAFLPRFISSQERKKDRKKDKRLRKQTQINRPDNSEQTANQQSFVGRHHREVENRHQRPHLEPGNQQRIKVLYRVEISQRRSFGDFVSVRLIGERDRTCWISPRMVSQSCPRKVPMVTMYSTVIHAPPMIWSMSTLAMVLGMFFAFWISFSVFVSFRFPVRGVCSVFSPGNDASNPSSQRNVNGDRINAEVVNCTRVGRSNSNGVYLVSYCNARDRGSREFSSVSPQLDTP